MHECPVPGPSQCTHKELCPPIEMVGEVGTRMIALSRPGVRYLAHGPESFALRTGADKGKDA